MTHEEQLLFGERLRRRRKALNLTQESVSEQVGITLRFYQMIERGEKSVSLDTLIALRRALAVSIDYLLFSELPLVSENPIAELLASLKPGQREDAAKILELYANACKSSKNISSM